MEELYQEALSKYKRGENTSLVRQKVQQTQVSPSRSGSYIPYPSPTDVDFQKNIFVKKEFYKNRYKPIQQNYEQEVEKQCSKNVFQMMEHQKFLKNFLSPYTPYNSILLFHSVGSGKSCTAISIAQQYTNVFKKKHLVLVSQNLKENFKKQLFDIEKIKVIKEKLVKTNNQCTGTRYPDMIADFETMPKDLANKKIQKLIQEEFEFKTYMEFSSDYAKLKKESEVFEKTPESQKQKFEELLHEHYSERVIIIDEVHNLRLSTAGTEKIVPPKIEHMLRVTNNVKLVLLTATPMFNQAEEIVFILNLMILNDGYEPIKSQHVFKDGKLTEEGANILANASRARISYVRGENPYAFPVRLYPDQKRDKRVFMTTDKPKKDIFGLDIKEKNTLEKMHLVKSYMSDEQIKVYGKVEELYESNKAHILAHEHHDVNGINGANAVNAVNVKEDSEKVDIQMGLQISNVIYPSKKDDLKSRYGFSQNQKRGFNQCFNLLSDKTMFQVEYKSKEEVFSPTLLKQYAPKLQTIIDYIENAKGIVYIYSNYIYSGIVPLAIALEHLGYKKYGGDTILKNGSKKAPNAKQFIILSANPKLSPNNDAEIEKVKSDKNKEGDIVKVILASNVGTEGLDFKNIREIHILEPWYHMQKIEQIIGRGARFCSHIGLPLEQRNVSVYLHVNVKKNDPDKETIDVRVYRIANTKQNEIKKIGNILKQNAVDCLLNREITYYDPDKVNKQIDMITSQGHVLKNYTLGDHEHIETIVCNSNNVRSEDIRTNDSTFRPSFFADDSQIYIFYVSLLYSKKLSYTYQEIKNELKTSKHLVEDEVLKYSLEQMLRYKLTVYNSEGNPGFLIYKGQYYIFQSLDHQNLRMTMDERRVPEYIDAKKRLDMKELSKYSSQVKNPSVSAKSKRLDASQVVKKIKDETKNLRDILAKCVNGDEDNVLHDYENVIIDYVVDRLNEQELFVLIETYAVANERLQQIDVAILESLKRSYLVYYTSSGFAFYVSMFAKPDDYKRFWILKENKLHTISVTEKKKYIDHETKLRNKIIKQFATIEGFVSHEGEQCKLKLIDRKLKSAKGSVCENDSKLKVGTIKEVLHGYEPRLKFTKFEIKKGEEIEINVPITKPRLCDLYELVLRCKRSNHFLRPYAYSLSQRKE